MSDDQPLVVLTGASGALGQVVATTLNEQDYRLVLLNRSALSNKAIPSLDEFDNIDFADQAALRACLQEIESQYGPIYGLVNCIGGFAMQTLAEAELSLWDTLYQQNLRPAVALTQAAVALMNRHDRSGRIIHVGAAAAAHAASAAMGPYLASKAGLMKMIEACADEQRANDININAVLPGVIDTPNNRAAMPDADFQQWTPPEHIGALIAYLLSPAAASVSGAGIPITNKS